MSKRSNSPYARIVRNACAGKGVRLTVEETRMLANDDAIHQVGLRDLRGNDEARKSDGDLLKEYED